METGSEAREALVVLGCVGSPVIVGGKALGHDKLLFIGGDWLLAEIRD